LHLPRAVLIAIVTAYLTAVLYFVLRLLHGLIRTRIILREAQDLPLNPAQSALLSHAAGPRRSIRIATSATLPGPVTLGFTQPVLLLPPHFLASVSEQDQLALFAHEAAHIRRHDFSLNLLYTALAVPIAFHPALWFTRNRLAETREMICDTLAARTLAGPEPYTQSLLRLALSLTAHPPASPLHAIGFLDANSFERRLMHLTELTTQPLVPSRLRRTLLASACAALAVITCTSALALHLEAPAPVPSGRAGQAQVAAGVMAGQILSKVAPIYPAEAKANHDTLDGPVKLHALIGKDGTIQNIYVQQSLRRDYDASALEAVRQWVYKPYLLNGEPTEVETTVTVTYSSDPSYNKK
jgi:TonB family protein